MMKQKILFLDVDGVLNKDSDWTPYVPPNNGYQVLNWDLVNELTDFVREHGITIVWISTWRLVPTQMQYIEDWTTLRDYEHEDPYTIVLKDFDDGLSWTQYHKAQIRGTEVAEWLGRHKGEYDSWAILDDHAQFLPDQQLNFVQTDEKVGVTHSDFIKLKEILIT